MARKKGQKATDSEEESIDQGEKAAEVQESYESQGQASDPEPMKPKPEPKRGKATPAGAYENHPKFAKFKRGS